MVATTSANESRTGNYMKRDMNNQTKNRTGASYNPKGNHVKAKESGYRASSYSKDYDKDEEYDTKGSKNHRTSGTKNYQNKEIDQPIDKLETIRRLEREKKVVQKKYREESHDDYVKPKRSQMKEKRVSKKDWTKNYIYGLYDEDEDYFDYI